MLSRIFNKNNSRAISCAACCLIILLTLAFIFNNSLANKEESAEQSGEVVEVVRPIIDPNENMSYDEISGIVRKGAHFVEFGALGLELALLFFILSSGFKLRDAIYSAGLALLVANTDELIQIYSERGSSVTDVFLDFGGGLFGIAAGYVIAISVRAVYRRIKSRKEPREVT